MIASTSTNADQASGSPPDSGTREHTTDGSGAPRQPQDSTPAPHPLEPLLRQAGIVREFALNYIEAQKDAARATVRRLVIKALLGAGAAIIGGTLVIACTVLLATGLAQLISTAAGGQPWIGNLAVGGGVLVILGLIVTVCIARLARTARDQTIRKYESRHNAQRAKFGIDVTERASS